MRPSFASGSAQFQSTPSVWRATQIAANDAAKVAFQSTPSVWRATHRERRRHGPHDISIHALRVEGDGGPALRAQEPLYFNPRPPCGGRHPPPPAPSRALDFNPRPPCGGRHAQALGERIRGLNFNPRPPCGGRLSDFPPMPLEIVNFNPRPPCGGRLTRGGDSNGLLNFNPRPPCGGRRARSATAPTRA